MKAKRRLSNFDFSVKGAHVALVERGANGMTILVKKSLEEKTEFSAEERSKLAQTGAAMADGSYPIRNRSDLSNAIQAYGRASDKAGVARHIRRRARALGASDMIPTEGKMAEQLKSWDAFKAFADKTKYDAATGMYHPFDTSGLRVNLSLEDALMLIREFYPENIETFCAAITKSENGDQLVAELEKAGTVPADFAARKAKFESVLKSLDKAALGTLGDFINKSIIKPTVEKSDMTTTTTPVSAEVQKAIDEAKATAAAEVVALTKKLADSEAARVALAADTAILKAAYDKAEAAEFVKKALVLKAIGFGQDQTEATVGAAMQKISKAAPAEYALIEAMLVQAADTIAKGAALATVGVDGQPAVNTNSEALQKAADALRAADKTLTPEAAVAKALEQNPGLYSR